MEEGGSKMVETGQDSVIKQNHLPGPPRGSGPGPEEHSEVVPGEGRQVRWEGKAGGKNQPAKGYE